MKSNLELPEFQAVESIFNAALDVGIKERPRFLEDACGGNAALRQRVDALLHAHEAAVLFLPETPALTSFDALQVNRNVGDYELLEEIARGGMGVVFKARQCKLDRIVALKMMLAGGFASREQVLRFRAEVETAARLQHPNIVRIHETGEEDGRPYFSMDYVAGPNLGSLVRERPLPAKHAANYVKTIAEAIHHAHEQGVLHRDLKPSNVLIDPDDQPRVTDFGLAKRMQKESFLTVTGEMMGSPSFMPPEQAGAKGIKAGRYSDVYSLGGILFYLVTGRPPFVAESVAETLHHVLNTEPVSPRLLNPGVPQDIATICLKCLEKQPSKRYQTAQQLADELTRFLSDEPIQARPAGRAEKAWRWCRRKPLIAGLSSATLLLVLAVAIGSPIAAFRIDRERQRAEANEKKAHLEATKSRQVAQFLEDMLKSVGPGVALGRDTMLLREILDKTVEHLSRDLQDQPDVEADLRTTIGKVFRELRDLAQAEVMHRQALGLRRQLLGNEHPAVANSLFNLGLALLEQRKIVEAKARLAEALAMNRKILGSDNREVAECLHALASAVREEGELDQAETMERDALEMRKRLLGSEHAEVAESLTTLAAVLQRKGELESAEATHREALTIMRKRFGGDHPDIALSLGIFGPLLRQRGKLAEAEAVCREELAMSQRLWGSNQPMLREIGERLSAILRDQGKIAETEALLRGRLQPEIPP